MKRFIAFMCLVCALLVQPLAHAELTEATALKRGMAQPHRQSLLKAQLEQARGEHVSAGRWHNPEIEYSREELDLPAGRSEESTWWLRQKLNISGSNGLERDAAAKALQAAEAQRLLQRRQWQAQIRKQFYAVLAAQMRAQKLAEHQQHLQTIATKIEQRVAQGDSSRYDSQRMAHELARAQSTYAQARAKQQAEYQRLFSLAGTGSTAVAGILLPPAIEPTEQALAQHPQLQVLAAQEQSAALNAKAARRRAWPEISVGVGRKTLHESGYSAEGNAVALNMEIPLFDRSQGEAQRARGLAREHTADYAFTRHRLRAQLQALRITLAAQRDSAQALQHATATGEGSLSAIAEASYRAGELGLLELLDAYRNELDTWLQYLSSAHAARNTFIDLQQLEGR